MLPSYTSSNPSIFAFLRIDLLLATGSFGLVLIEPYLSFLLTRRWHLPMPGRVQLEFSAFLSRIGRGLKPPVPAVTRSVRFHELWPKCPGRRLDSRLAAPQPATSESESWPRAPCAAILRQVRLEGDGALSGS